MNDDNLASDYLPEPPTPTSNALPLGEFIILESLNKWNRGSSKITRLIYHIHRTHRLFGNQQTNVKSLIIQVQDQVYLRKYLL